MEVDLAGLLGVGTTPLLLAQPSRVRRGDVRANNLTQKARRRWQ